MRQIDFVRLMRHKAFERISPDLGFSQKFPGIGNIAGQSAGVGTVDPRQASQESGLGSVVGTANVPVGKKMLLAVCQ
ncbi:MAG: hypothetical protein WCG03_02935 [Kiritimatiellales bacterium]